MIRLVFLGVDYKTEASILLFKEKDGERYLVVPVSRGDALMVAAAVEPGTGLAVESQFSFLNFVNALLARAKAKIACGLIYGVKDNVWKTRVIIDHGDDQEDKPLDCCPAVAFLLCAMGKASFFCEDKVFADQCFVFQPGVGLVKPLPATSATPANSVPKTENPWFFKSFIQGLKDIDFVPKDTPGPSKKQELEKFAKSPFGRFISNEDELKL